MELIYNDVDIYPEIHIQECIYEANFNNSINKARILFQNTSHEWNHWGVKQNDKIRIMEESIDTGHLYIEKFRSCNGYYELFATSVKSHDYEQTYTKAWNNITFKELMSEVASRHELECEFYDVTNRAYSYVIQKHERDFEFAARIATLEGCTITIFNQKMIVVNEAMLESTDTDVTLEIDAYDCNLYYDMCYGSCVVSNGSSKGSFKISDAPEFSKIITHSIDSKSDANRFAKNLLRYRNKMSNGLIVSADELKSKLSAGSLVFIDSDDYAEIAQSKMLVYRIRQDLKKSSSKIWLRKCLEGY